MKSVAQVLPPNTVEKVVQQVAAAEVNNPELVQFRFYLEKMDSKQLRSLTEELRAAARVRGRRIVLREQLLSRLGTDWLRKQQEFLEADLARIEVGKDTIDFNTLELELSTQTWRLGKSTQVRNLDEQAADNPLIDMIKRQESDTEAEAMAAYGGLDDEQLEGIFGLR